MTNLCFFRPIRISDHDETGCPILTFRSVAEIEAHFRLSKPLVREEVDEILRIGAAGVVHACVCPFAQDVHDVTCLMLSAESSELDEDAYERAMDI